VALLLIGALVVWLDILTGTTPDLTILYLAPIVIVTFYFGLVPGIVTSLLAAVLQAYTNVGMGQALRLDVVLDGGLHFFVFVLISVLLNRLLLEYRTIRSLEERRTYEFGLAKEVQKTLFSPPPDRFADLRIAVRLAFAREVGGDYYFFSQLGERLFFGIGDISGKGVPAALFSALLKYSLVDSLASGRDLQETVAIVNERMWQALPENMFVTLFCCFIEPESIVFINAGHVPPLLFSRGAIEELKTAGTLPIGIKPQLDIQAESRPFLAGNILLAVTDGVTESPLLRDDPVPILQSVLSRHARAGARRISDKVFEAATQGVESPTDDIVVACVKRGRMKRLSPLGQGI